MNDDDTPEKIDPLRFIGLSSRKKRTDKKYASFNRRMLAATLDSFLLIFSEPLVNWIAPIDKQALSYYPIDSADPLERERWVLNLLSDHRFLVSWADNFLAQMVIFALFSAVCWHFWGATPGKMLTRIKIVDAQSEQRISLRQILLRIAGYGISGAFAFIGFFWIGIDKRKQGWHDKIAHTVVIVLPWRKAALD